jgi:DNA-binding NarL/FixJ family response regulator
MAKRGERQLLVWTLRVMNEQSELKRPRILLADDHLVVLQRVAKLLESVFDVVGSARTGREMVTQAMLLNPDVIVVDISMPELSGIEAVQELRKSGSTVKVVFLTIHSEDEFVQACFAEGALGYVVKAHMKTDLIPAINAALSGHPFVSLTS